MRALLDVVLIVLDFYIWLLVIMVILSWLIAFNVVNSRNQLVAGVMGFLRAITEPLLAPIRRRVPTFNGIDISVFILFLLIILVTRVIIYYIYPYVP
ncbi:MAG: YggT family protein [Alphaproteobacteria bacterium]|nr:YggT family protein [Alphaproteobacteria bacterium]